jgi:hypothetical protein
MRIVVTRVLGGYRLRFPYDAAVVARIKELPRHTREWEPDEKAWFVPDRWLLTVKSHLTRTQDVVWEAAEEPETPAEAFQRGWEAGLRQARESGMGVAGLTEAHRALWVLPGAPVEVVKAAFRALAARAHPDVGGTHEGMVKLNAAYETLLGKRTR